MKIMCLRSYSHGYTGFMEEKNQYVFFQFPRRGNLRKVMTFNKSDFTSYRHFVGGISKFIPHIFFLEAPVPVKPVTIHALDGLFQEHYVPSP